MHPEGARQALQAQKAAGAPCCHKPMTSMKLPVLTKEEAARVHRWPFGGLPQPQVYHGALAALPFRTVPPAA